MRKKADVISFKALLWCLLGVNRSPFSEPIGNDFVKQAVGTNRTNINLGGIFSYNAASLWIVDMSFLHLLMPSVPLLLSHLGLPSLELDPIVDNN
jgi:hypothetical protein